MNKKVILSWLSIVMMVTTSACGTRVAAAAAAFQVTGTPGTPPTVDLTETPSTETPIPPTTETVIATGTPMVFPTPEGPFIPFADKPSISFSPFELPPVQPIIGYTFPGEVSNWTIPFKVTSFVDIIIDPSDRFTPVGMLEIGGEPSLETEPRIYLVSLDLISTADTVRGKLVSINTTDAFDVTFRRMPQILNPERTDSPYSEFQELDSIPDTFTTIYADGTCFVIKTDDTPTYVKYCSRPTGPNQSPAPLSIQDNFPEQYAELQAMITDVAEQFELENVLQLDEVISAQESIQNIQNCASDLSQESCSADVVVAPVRTNYFENRYNEVFGGGDDDDDDDGDDDDNGEDDDDGDDEGDGEDGVDGGEDDDNGGNDKSTASGSPFNFSSLRVSLFQSGDPTAFEVAVVKVLLPIETSDGTILPGDYRLDYWFDADGLFYAATITGTTADNTPVVNQPIPAVPAALINADKSDPKQPDAQISACRIFNRCAFFQRRCG